MYISPRTSIVELCKALCTPFITAHAEDEAPDNSGGNTSPSVNFEQLIAAARKEEKEKLYPRIKKLEDENARLVQVGNDNLIKIGDLTKALETAQTELAKYKSGEVKSEEVTKLQEQVNTLTAENERLKAETPDAEAIRAEIEKEYSVKAYVSEQRTAHKDDVIPSLLDLITGTTNEEVDAAVAKAVEQSTKIKQELGLLDADGNPINSTPSGNTKKPAAKKSTTQRPPVANPSGDTGETTLSFDAEAIRNMDVSSPEYAEFRKKLGLK